MLTKLLLCAVAAAIAAPALLTHRQGPSPENISHVKQAGLAVLMYCNDYDDVYPYAQSTGAVVSVTAPYSKNIDIWWSVDGRRFLFNGALGGSTSSAVEQPAQTVCIYAEKPNSDGDRETGFTDGHAKRLPSEAWKTVEPTLHLKLAKTAKKPLPSALGAEYNTQLPPKKS